MPNADQWVVINNDGNFRGTPEAEKDLFFMVKTSSGREPLSQDEFAAKYGAGRTIPSVRIVHAAK